MRQFFHILLLLAALAWGCADAEVSDNTNNSSDSDTDSDSDSDADSDTDSDTDADTDPPDCDTPPSNFCGDAGVLVSHAENGVWNGTDCEYASTTTPCDSPPADTCVGLTAWVYQPTGQCVTDQCEYDHQEEECGSECDGGVCLGCDQGTNVAPTASPSTSGGGSGSYGPTSLNNGNYESSCEFCWINSGQSLAGGGYFQYQWSTPQELWGLHIDTKTTSSCSSPSNGRNLAGADIQWWDGSAWVTDGTVTGQTGDWDYEFTSPITTTQVRLYNAHSQSTDNAAVFEWEVFACN